jgi:hypothetical protein
METLIPIPLHYHPADIRTVAFRKAGEAVAASVLGLPFEQVKCRQKDPVITGPFNPRDLGLDGARPYVVMMCVGALVVIKFQRDWNECAPDVLDSTYRNINYILAVSLVTNGDMLHNPSEDVETMLSRVGKHNWDHIKRASHEAVLSALDLMEEHGAAIFKVACLLLEQYEASAVEVAIIVAAEAR